MTDKELRSYPGKVMFMRALSKLAMRMNWKNKAKLIYRTRGLYYRNKYNNSLSAHEASNVYFKDHELEAFGLEVPHNDTAPSWAVSNTVDDAMKKDLEDFMPGDVLVKIDRASMANSLELRAPFLDVPFAEFSISLPYQLKINSNEDKIILRRSFEQDWPEEIRRRGKLGFGAPINLWLKKPGVIGLIDEYLKDPKKKIFTILPFEQVKKYVDKVDYKVWVLLSLSVWLEKHNFTQKFTQK
jgi:asparagine synthase (glutamine-hydrolysing)